MKFSSTSNHPIRERIINSSELKYYATEKETKPGQDVSLPAATENHSSGSRKESSGTFAGTRRLTAIYCRINFPALEPDDG